MDPAPCGATTTGDFNLCVKSATAQRTLVIRERRANTEAGGKCRDEPQPISRCGRRHESSIAVSFFRIYKFDRGYACIRKNTRISPDEPLALKVFQYQVVKSFCGENP